MSRSLLLIITLASLLTLALGYIAFTFDSERIGGFHEVALPPPDTVKLPFDKFYLKGAFQLKITALSGQTDAVKIKVYVSAGRTFESREWIQQGTGTIVFTLSGGKDRYFLSIGEMNSDGQTVTSVKVALRYKFISGPR